MKKMFDWPMDKRCLHQSHDPPTMIVLQPGSYEHKCPSCGHVTIVRVPPKPSLRGRP